MVIIFITVVVFLIIILLLPKTRIDEIVDNHPYYIIKFAPTKLGKLLRIKSYEVKVKDTGSTYLFGSGVVYMDASGRKLGNSSSLGSAVDRFRRQKEY